MKYRLATICLLGAACVMAFTIYRGQVAETHAFKRADRAACVRIEMLKTGFRGSLQRALTTLPTLAYYKAHPQELAKQIQLVKDQIKEYAPSKC